jgi:hypothetical protein
MKYVGMAKIRELIPQLDSTKFSREVFEHTGIFVIRGAIPAETIQRWRKAWDEFFNSEFSSGRPVNKYNPVAVDQTPPPELADMHRDPSLLDVVEMAFGPDIGLYNQRFVVKDRHSRGPVFLHNDYPYHIGWPTKASAFVPLSSVSAENGGMTFYPGTHQYGYLGDAGELNRELLGSDWPTICPSLEPGDFALMNSSTWHESGPHVGGPDRIMADIIYQPASDPSCIALLRGQWQTEIFLNRHSKTKIFNTSRSSKLQEMQNRLDQFEAERKSAV